MTTGAGNGRTPFAWPIPSWPDELSPQHQTAPVAVSAQLWSKCEAMALTPLVSPGTSTGVKLSVVELLPSWPYSLLPQHFTPPVVVSAQLPLVPDAMAVTPLLRPATPTGVKLVVVELSPSCPFSFKPQHLTAPSVVSTQRWL